MTYAARTTSADHRDRKTKINFKSSESVVYGAAVTEWIIK